MTTLTLLARAYCHLCDEMLARGRPIAAAHAAPIVAWSTSTPHPALEADVWRSRPGAVSPARQASGTELCRHRFDSGARRLRRSRGARLSTD